MIPLAQPLDTIDFDALFEIARSKLPNLAPDWTDYNYSDPGITLVDLLAWVADRQVYSLARNRRDERFAMASLLGLASVGAVPAAGVVYPARPVSAGAHVPAGARLVPVGACAPRIEIEHDVELSGLRIASIVTEGAGAPIDHTATNDQPRATYAPFGAPPSVDTTLRLRLEGALRDEMVAFPLGFELDDDDPTSSGELGPVIVEYVAPDGAKVELKPTYDSTAHLRRSGVMILILPQTIGRGSDHELSFRPARATLMPRLRRITPDALPVRQRAALQPDVFIGNGRPGQVIEIAPLTLFDPVEAAEGYVWRLSARKQGLDLSVQVEDEAELQQWSQDRLDDAAADDRIFEIDERPDGTSIAIRFGNGCNGKRPAEGAQIVIEARVSAGTSGNIASGIDWVLDGMNTRWTNREPIDGASDADDLKGLLAKMRARLRSERPLATSAQIEQAALSLPEAFEIDRAKVIEGWQPGRIVPAWPATRTLLVTRKADLTDPPLETEDWRRAIARRLRPRVALGERLIIASPARRPLRIRVRAIAAPRRAPADVAREIRELLVARLSSQSSATKPWALGREATGLAVGGWIRRLSGVARVLDVTLIDELGTSFPDNSLPLGRGDLPRFISKADDVVVTGARP